VEEEEAEAEEELGQAEEEEAVWRVMGLMRMRIMR
jgi:hypothetical protein